MRYLNLQQSVLVSFLATGVASWMACSSGSDPATSSTAATSSGAGGSGSSSTAATGGTGTTAAGSSTAATGGTPTTTAGAGGAASTSATTGSTTTTTGAGGSGGSAPAGPSVCDGAGTRILGLGDGVIDAFRGTAVALGWSAFNDTTPTNSVKPTLDSASGGGMPAAPPSLHYTGMGAKPPTMGGFGVGLLYNLAIDTTAKIYCVDISAFDGVSFWAKGTAGSKIGVNFVTPQTNPVATDPAIGGGDCVLMVPGTATTNPVCYNHPQKLVTLTDAWAQYTVTFAEAVGGTSRVHNVLQLFGFLSPDANWNFWVDEIQFYKGTAPVTPIPVSDAGP